MPQRIGRALAYALLIWITGFVWGTVVFMTPAMKEVPAIPYVSRYPLISFPLLILFPLIAYVLARIHFENNECYSRRRMPPRLAVRGGEFCARLPGPGPPVQKRLQLLRLPDRVARLFHFVDRAVVNWSLVGCYE
jgi:hypothetical protein